MNGLINSNPGGFRGSSADQLRQPKAIWQRRLIVEQKYLWEAIVTVFHGQYGIYLHPRAAYQRCHKLQYESYGSAQGPLNAMRDFQRMAPDKLTDSTLESILWNKVPVKLQKKVKEITGSVQELLQKFLIAESVIAERKRCSQPRSASRETQETRTRTSNRQL